MGYSVTDTRQVDSLTQAGNVRKVFRVWLITDNGATGSVDIPEAQWKPDLVPDILAEKAESLDLAFVVANGS